jgi:hypothetical protein
MAELAGHQEAADVVGPLGQGQQPAGGLGEELAVVLDRAWWMSARSGMGHGFTQQSPVTRHRALKDSGWWGGVADAGAWGQGSSGASRWVRGT